MQHSDPRPPESGLPAAGLRWERIIAIWLSVAAHIAAGFALLLVQQGTEIGGAPPQRLEFVASHPQLWTAAWSIWMIASASFLAFAIAWTAKIWETSSDAAERWISAAACVLGLLGISCDLAGETTLIFWLPHAKTPEEFLATYRIYQWLSPAIANGLYCLAGLLLSAISWRQGWLAGLGGAIGFGIWTIGLVLTIAAIVDSTSLMLLTGAATIGLFIPWQAWLGYETGKA